MRHASFIARTVLVHKGNIEEAMKILNAVLSRDGIFQQYRLTRRYEKPTHMRRRVNYLKCKAIYDEDMDRKINFILRTNREDPYPGCS